MPEWLIHDQYLNARRSYAGETNFSADNFDHDPNTVSTYDAMGTPQGTLGPGNIPQAEGGWSPIFPVGGVEQDIAERSQSLMRESAENAKAFEAE
jgi:hypothetical protein